MGQAEVDLFHRWTEQLGAAENPIDVWYEEIWAADIDYRAIEGAPDDVGPIRDRDGMRAHLAEWHEMFPDIQSVPGEIIDAGPETLIVLWRATGTASGAKTELRFAQSIRIQGSKMVWGREYMTEQEALDALEREGLAG